MFDPTRLDSTINGLQQDAGYLRDIAGQLASERSQILFAGPRADRFFNEIDRRRQELFDRAVELDNVADKVQRLKADVDREIRILRSIEDAVRRFLQEVENVGLQLARDATAAVNDVAHGNLRQGAADVEGAITLVARVFAGWSWHPNNIPPPGDSRWRDVHHYMAAKSGVYGCYYNAPATR